MSHEQGMFRVAKVAVAASLALFGVGLVSTPSALAGGDLTADEVLNSRLVTRSIDSHLAGPVGGKVRCKADERLLTGGAFWHITGASPDPIVGDVVHLTSSAPVDERTWYADGFNNYVGGLTTPLTLTIEARCLPKRDLEGMRMTEATQVARPGKEVSVRAQCSNNRVPVSGGTFISKPGEGPKPDFGPARGGIASSFSNGQAWEGLGGNFVGNKKLALRATANCVRMSDADPELTVAPTPVEGDHEWGGGYVACPSGAAVNAGAFWSQVGAFDPDPALVSHTYLSGNAVTFQADGSWVAGLNESPGTLDLVKLVACVEA